MGWRGGREGPSAVRALLVSCPAVLTVPRLPWSSVWLWGLAVLMLPALEGMGGLAALQCCPQIPLPHCCLFFQMGLSTHWGEWVQTPPPRHWSVSMSQQRTTGSPYPPCPPRAMEPLPSCRETRSSSWVRAAGANPASPAPLPSPSSIPRPENDLVHPRVASCCPALQPVGPILLAGHANSASLGHWQLCVLCA